MTKPILAVSILLVACGNQRSSEGLEPPETEPPKPAPTAGSAGAGSAGSAEPPTAKRTVLENVGFATPESVLYDAEADSYLVSNIGGSPFDKDDNGFVSRVSPEGKVVELKWIDGATPEVKLDAPKGMAISGGVLWVADIDTMRKFDAKTGKPIGEVKVTGSVFLNDVVADGAEGVYVTDTAMNAKVEADAVYHITKAGKVTAIVKDPALSGPNGIAVDGGPPVVVTFESGEILRLASKGAGTAAGPVVGPATIAAREKLPKGQLDGLIALGGGEYLVSSHEGKTVYRGKPFTEGKPTEWKDLELAIEAPADLGHDTKRGRLLIPHLAGNAVTIAPL